MAPPVISYQIPASFYAGDTLYFIIQHPDFKASDGWLLNYVFVKSAVKVAIVSTASGDNHLFNVAKTTTANYTAGDYSYYSYFEKSGGTERYNYTQGTISILANYSAQTSGFDARSLAKTIVDALEAVLKGDTSATNLLIISQNCGDLSISRKSDVFEEYQKWKALYQAEVSRSEIESGKRNPQRTIHIGFNTI